MSDSLYAVYRHTTEPSAFLRVGVILTLCEPRNVYARFPVNPAVESVP